MGWEGRLYLGEGGVPAGLGCCCCPQPKLSLKPGLHLIWLTPKEGAWCLLVGSTVPCTAGEGKAGHAQPGLEPCAPQSSPLPRAQDFSAGHCQACHFPTNGELPSPAPYLAMGSTGSHNPPLGGQ